MKRIYLSKSNRSNPNHVMAARQELGALYPDAIIVEHMGGRYNSDLLTGSDVVFCVGSAEEEINVDQDKDLMVISVGRGLYSEAELMLQKGDAQNKECAFYCYFRQGVDGFEAHRILATEATDLDNFIKYGSIVTDTNSTPFGEIV